jgi:hypothetical protein
LASTVWNAKAENRHGIVKKGLGFIQQILSISVPAGIPDIG